ncbi:MAG: ribosomal protein S18-alanine N-acetyltransferase [Bacteriovoracia bacterium]
MEIVPFEKCDLKEVLRIEGENYELPLIAWTQTQFEEELKKPFSKIFVSKTEDKVVGYIVYWKLFDEIHILNVAVAKAYQGRGIAKKLVQLAQNEPSKRCFLEVRVSNAIAVKLYKSLGFFIDSVRKQFYENGEDAYFMVYYA